eukprot:6196173-Pleurochrysis_carterae.AAC.1
MQNPNPHAHCVPVLAGYERRTRHQRPCPYIKGEGKPRSKAIAVSVRGTPFCSAVFGIEGVVVVGGGGAVVGRAFERFRDTSGSLSALWSFTDFCKYANITEVWRSRDFSCSRSHNTRSGI